MTEPTGPFTPGDPLAYDELPPEGRAWRAVLHMLAVTGRSLTLPADLAPAHVLLAVSTGWRYRYDMTVHPDRPDEVTLTAALTGWPEQQPGEDPAAFRDRVNAHLAGAGAVGARRSRHQRIDKIINTGGPP